MACNVQDGRDISGWKKIMAESRRNPHCRIGPTALEVATTIGWPCTAVSEQSAKFGSMTSLVMFHKT